MVSCTAWRGSYPLMIGDWSRTPSRRVDSVIPRASSCRRFGLVLVSERKPDLHITLRDGVALDRDHAAAGAEHPAAAVDQRRVAARLKAQGEALAQRQQVAQAEAQ